jgi:3-oxoacyl-[acyl-carrier protein] reductase
MKIPIIQNSDYFNSKTIVITGAGTGYGRALSIAFLSCNANVILIGRRKEKLEKTIELANNTNKALALSCDITNNDNLKYIKNKILNKYKSVDILINCAAIPPHNDASLSTASEQRWDNMMNINLKAQWLISKEMFTIMTNKIARILFFTSGAGWSDSNKVGLYNISKAALNSLTISMAKEFELDNPLKTVSINAINPEQAKTEMNYESNISPFEICEMVFKILSTIENIPNGKFFRRNGKYVGFGNTLEYEYELK